MIDLQEVLVSLATGKILFLLQPMPNSFKALVLPPPIAPSKSSTLHERSLPNLSDAFEWAVSHIENYATTKNTKISEINNPNNAEFIGIQEQEKIAHGLGMNVQIRLNGI